MKLIKTAALLTLLVLLSFSYTAYGQVEPDTVKRKRELPTGPPGSQTQPPSQPRVIQQSPPPVVKQVPQEEEEENIPFKDRLYTGGSFGFQFGTYTNISLLPILGYRATERFSVGVGIVYNYIKISSYSFNTYGARAFTQFEIVDIGNGALLAHAEVEGLSSEYPRYNQSGNYDGNARSTVALPLAGLGYRQRISDRASFDLLLLYNFSPLTQDEGNPYSNPVIRAGFNFPITRSR